MKLNHVAMAVLLGLVGVSASAAQINGTLSFNGPVVTLEDVNGAVVTDFNQATQANFSPNAINLQSFRGTGDIASAFPYTGGFAPSGTGTIQDFSFVNGSPVANLFRITSADGRNDLAFDLGTVVSAVMVRTGSQALSVLGEGVLRLTGFDPTPGTYAFSTQATTGATELTWSATTGSTVPAPSSLALIGLASIGLGASLTKRSNKAVKAA